jgi:hypothetical protein
MKRRPSVVIEKARMWPCSLWSSGASDTTPWSKRFA